MKNFLDGITRLAFSALMLAAVVAALTFAARPDPPTSIDFDETRLSAGLAAEVDASNARVDAMVLAREEAAGP